MNIVVLLKQVPDTTEMKIDKDKGTLIRTGVPTITNPDDLAGFEAALKIKDEKGAHVICVTMGPPQAEGMLRELYAMGADECILVSDGKFSGADTWATSNTLGAVLGTIDYDLIIAGRQAIDGDTAQVGPQTAEKLHLPQITYVDEILEIDKEKIIVRKALENSYEIISSSMPCLITTLSTIARPRYMNVGKIMQAFDQNIRVVTYEDLNLDPLTIGLKGSPTKVKKTYTKEVHKNSDILTLDPRESARKIFETLMDNQYIGK
ncbi:electron transfer flavoprotein subunit beta/FixA family protein [Proteiniclasticum sp.]|uniref:electron transfer flavoprotein subunit beta/FixA family protein n=1 Tax=Proteiniclasticum sp. TaxID=2053595 RepID=UPI0028A1DC87|nr:electron transfer flavoprotein subunit beta/FixA family protein [Proteiniclasticum sp.]